MKVTNTLKHAAYSHLVGGIAGWIHAAINQIPKTEAYFWWFFILIWAMVVLVIEYNQKRYSMNPNYLKDKWLDIIVDITAGMAGFVIGLAPLWILFK